MLELMVVIAVIGLLISVLVPAILSAKAQAKLAVCQARGGENVVIIDYNIESVTLGGQSILNGLKYLGMGSGAGTYGDGVGGRLL